MAPSTPTRHPRISLTTALLIALAITLLAYAVGAEAATQATNYKHEVGISGQVITTTGTAQFFTVPLGAEHAFITVEGASACWSHNIDGTAPTPTNSARWLAGTQFMIPNDPLMLKRIRVISCTGAAATVTVYYSRARRVGDAQ